MIRSILPPLAVACAVLLFFAPVANADTITVPDVRGQAKDAAVDALTNAGLTVERVLVMSPEEYRTWTGLTVADGTVVQQSPPAGSAERGEGALLRIVRIRTPAPIAAVPVQVNEARPPVVPVVVPYVASAPSTAAVAPVPAGVAVATATAAGTRMHRRGFSISIEPLYMKFRPADTAFAIEDTGGPFSPSGSLKSLEWDYEFGIRGGVSWAPQGKSWDIGVRATWLEGSSSATATAPAGGGVGVLLYNANNAPPTVAGPARANSSIELLEIDLTMGTSFDIGNDGAGRLFFGGRFATLDQSYDVIYDDSAVNGNTYTRNASADMQAFGAVVGFETGFELGSGFGFFGSLAGAMMVGDTKSKLRESQTTTGAGTVDHVDIQQSFERVIPVLEAAVGISWDKRLGGRSHLRLRLSYEFQNWFNVLDVNQFPDDLADQVLTRNTTDIGIDGIVGRIDLTF